MTDSTSDKVQHLTRIAVSLQQQRTGVAPKAVTAVVTDDTVVVNLHDALTPAEKALARTPKGAAQIQEFHQQLVTSSMESMREEIRKFTGWDVREVTAVIETTTSTVVNAFTTGMTAQVFVLTDEVNSYMDTECDAIERADDDGFHPALQPDSSKLIQHGIKDV